MKFNRKYLENIVKLQHCACKEPIRYALCGVQQKDQDLVAADGHKLALIKTDSAANIFWQNDEIKKLKTFLKTCKRIQEFEYNTETKLLTGGAESVFLVLDFSNEYPDYKRILPKKTKSITVTFNAEYLLELSKALNEEKQSGITLKIPLEGKLMPITCEAFGNLGVLMPMRK